MEYQKTINLLDTTPDNIPKFITKKWIEVPDQSGRSYDINKQIRFDQMLRSNVYNYCDAYIVVRGTITVTGTNRNRRNRNLAFRNNPPFIGCISKIKNVLTDNKEDLDIVMPMYNLTEYNKNYSKKTSSLWNYYRDELSDDKNDTNSSNKNIIKSESFKYKTNITRTTYNVDEKITNADGNEFGNPAYDVNKIDAKEVEIAVPLKYLINFWRNFDMLLINCEISLTLTQPADCVITTMEKRAITATRRDGSPTGATFKITDTKQYVPVVTLSTEDDNKLLEQLKLGFKITIKWNKYR